MSLFRSIGITIVVVLGIYLALMLSYILIPASVFLFVLFVVHSTLDTDKDL